MSTDNKSGEREAVDEVAARLRAACDGHPHAKIDWPHYVLHEGADRIDGLIAQIEAVERELKLMKTAGIIEVAVRNPSVADYIDHWETRATTAEAQVTSLQQQVAELKGALEGKDIEQFARVHYDQRMGRIGAYDDAPPGVQATERNYALTALTYPAFSTLTREAPNE